MSLSRNPEPITQDNTDVDTLSLAVLCKEACINSWMRGQLNKLTKLASITAQSRRTALIFTSCPVIHEEMHVSSCAVIRCSLKERSVERKWSTVPLKEKEVYKTDIILVYVFWHEVSLTAHHTQNMNAHAIPHYHQQMALKSHFVSTVNLTVGTQRYSNCHNPKSKHAEDRESCRQYMVWRVEQRWENNNAAQRSGTVNSPGKINCCLC